MVEGVEVLEHPPIVSAREARQTRPPPPGGSGEGQDAASAFDPSFDYVASLLFLAVFATAIAFGGYLTLLGRLGADRAAYIMVLFPIVALAMSTAFESFHWSATTAGGVALVLLGNLLTLMRLPAAWAGRKAESKA